MENLEFDLNEVFNQIRDRRETQGAFTRQQYMDFIDEVLEEKHRNGELPDDFNDKQAHEALESRWPELANSDNLEASGAGDPPEERSGNAA